MLSSSWLDFFVSVDLRSALHFRYEESRKYFSEIPENIHRDVGDTSNLAARFLRDLIPQINEKSGAGCEPRLDPTDRSVILQLAIEGSRYAAIRIPSLRKVSGASGDVVLLLLVGHEHHPRSFIEIIYRTKFERRPI